MDPAHLWTVEVHILLYQSAERSPVSVSIVCSPCFVKKAKRQAEDGMFSNVTVLGTSAGLGVIFKDRASGRLLQQ